jgi:hypothetical protein
LFLHITKEFFEAILYYSFSFSSTAARQVYCDLTSVFLTSSRSRLGSSNWLQAKQTNISYRPGKPEHIFVGITDARECQTNTNYCYLETGFYLFVEYSLVVRTVVFHAHFWYDKFCTHNLINRRRIIVTLCIVIFNKYSKGEKGIVLDSADASDHFCVPFLKVMPGEYL